MYGKTIWVTPGNITLFTHNLGHIWQHHTFHTQDLLFAFVAIAFLRFKVTCYTIPNGAFPFCTFFGGYISRKVSPCSLSWFSRLVFPRCFGPRSSSNVWKRDFFNDFLNFVCRVLLLDCLWFLDNKKAFTVIRWNKWKKKKFWPIVSGIFVICQNIGRSGFRIMKQFQV